MRDAVKILQIAFTYIGTVIGAGFASGQEILQFFTRYGAVAIWAIAAAALLFVWLGVKVMLLAHDIKARSYEDLNRRLFGDKAGRIISLVMLAVLFGITSVMLAGAGAVLREQFQIPYQIGLIATLVCAYFVIVRGVDAILAVNSVIVPFMLLLTAIIVIATLYSPNADFWLNRSGDGNWLRLSLSPLLYTGFNLALAQAVLVPIGSSIRNRKHLIWGGIIGGAGIALMLLAGHIALSAEMPGIAQFEIPMAAIVEKFGPAIQLLFVLLIYAEIFTTLIADVYGLTLQLEQKMIVSRPVLIMSVLLLSYAVSQIGFGNLIGTLYPLFGLISLVWLWRMIRFPSSSGVW